MNHLTKYWIMGFCGIFLMISCTSNRNIALNFNRCKKQVAEELVPDPTVNIFEAYLTYQDGRWRLEGETTLESAQQRMTALADRLLGDENYENRMSLLPSEDVMPDHYGVVRVSTANLRAKPRHSAELVDQAIMGQTLRLLKQTGDWFLVQTDYDYIGWMTRESFFRTDPDGLNSWSKAATVSVRSNCAVIYSEPDTDSVPITTVTLNALLKLDKAHNHWTKVIIPDGREGFIKSDCITPPAQLQFTNLSLRESIIKTAVSMTGVPYLWGGNSSQANDCSGFVQTVFRANGVQLPRDARQQAGKGTEVGYSSDFSELEAGDLLFFGEAGSITHVAISLGGPRFIHQSGDVHVNSLDPDDDDFNLPSKETLITVKRIIREQIQQ
jgi:hypothetical protein